MIFNLSLGHFRNIESSKKLIYDFAIIEIESFYSAYCGGLWLGALYSMIQMADCMEKIEDKDYYTKLFNKGKTAFEKLLWNGSFYNFDGSTNDGNSIMADQLCVHWYLRCCGVKDYPVRKRHNISWH